MDANVANRDWKKVKQIFHESLRRHPDEREAFLNESCGDDVDLRIEVESLLLSLDEAKTFLEQPAVVLSPATDVSWQFRNGELISHYRILEPIGVGGMGQVYLAEDENLYRQVALKILPREVVEDIDRLRRFKREALAVSALNHPNILTIFEFVDVDGIPVLVSEYVRGCTLRERLKKERLDLNVAMDIGIQIASALQTAHDAGVIHRDIKPENIMIRDDGYVKVLDFGLAKLTGDLRSKEIDKAPSRDFSTPGMIMGTASYMSPEQATSMPVDARTDIFSLGIVLYEMVGSRVPFAGETTTDIIAEIIQARPVDASAYNPAVPEKLDRIIGKCLEKRRQDRYQSISELVVDLRSLSAAPIAEDVPPEPSTDTIPIQMLSMTEPADIANDLPGGISSPKYRSVKIVVAVALILVIAAASYWFWSL